MSRKRGQKIILFYSPQGGSGKSTLAVATAIFGVKEGFKTLLVDMASYGGVCSMLKIPQKGDKGLSAFITLLDIHNQEAKLLEITEMVKNSIAHDVLEINLDVLTSANPVKMEAMNGNYTKTILNILKSFQYDLIVIDTSSELNEKNLICIELSDNVVIPVIQDLSCGWKVLQFKEVMEKYSISDEKFKLIINKCSRYSGFHNMEFEHEIGYRLEGEIPLYAKQFQEYVNAGVQIHLIKNKKVNKAFKNIANKLLNI